jgi:HlyD family secretion protein
MKPTMNGNQISLRRTMAVLGVLTVMFCVAGGCSTAVKEKEPVVSVQTTPAERGPISQIISADAVVYPLEQATVAPKISAPIKKFYVQRGTRVKKGQLLVQLENSDLSAAAESSKGDFELAEANYATTVGSSLPQQIQ